MSLVFKLGKTPIMLPDMDKIIAIVAAAADAEIMTRFRHLKETDVKSKTHPGDLVTEADVRTEQVLTARLTELLPGSAVVGEEAVYANPDVLKLLDGDAPLWIVDPVDGTSNFVKGRPTFGVIVALAQNRKTLLGLIYDPTTRTAIAAEKGAGAWHGERRLHVAGKGMPLAALDGDFGSKSKAGALAGAVRRCVHYGSSAHAYMALAEARIHVAVAEGSHPWDHAAGLLIHAEAGGVNKTLDGTPYSLSSGGGGIIAAPDEAVWNTLRDLVALEERKRETARDSAKKPEL